MPQDKYEKKFRGIKGGMAALNGRKLSEFGKVQGDVFMIRGPEVIKGSGVRTADIAMAAAVAGAAYYQMGKGGKKIKIGTPKPKDTGPKALRAKPNPLKKFTKGKSVPQGKAYGGKAMKTYAMGGGIRKAKTYG